VLVVYIGDDGMGWTLNAFGLQPKLPFIPTIVIQLERPD